MSADDEYLGFTNTSWIWDNELQSKLIRLLEDPLLTDIFLSAKMLNSEIDELRPSLEVSWSKDPPEISKWPAATAPTKVKISKRRNICKRCSQSRKLIFF